jgi:hypothetical protein
VPPFRSTVCGFGAAPTAERAGFGVSGAFATTVAMARAINYVRERRRRLPRLRSMARRVYHSPGVSRVRVHHFVPGFLMVLAAGGASILTRSDGREVWFSLPFGVGAGLAADEIGLLVELDNPYWGGEKVAFAQSAVAALAAATLVMRFHQRGSAALGELPQGAASEGW